VAVAIAVAVPQTLVGLERSRAKAAARYLASRMALARVQAVAQSRSIGLRFQPHAGGFTVALVADGNGNGLRTREIESGTDLLVEPPVLLGDLYPGVAIVLPPGATDDDPLQLGTSGLLSFSPSGTSSSASVYLRGRDRSQFSVRILGVTGRVRVLRYDEARREWMETL
jgi:hypothetical protein